MRAAVTVLSFAALLLLFARRERSWRTGFVLAAAAWGTALVALSEGLGRLGALTRGAVTVAWLAGAALAWLAQVRAWRAAPAWKVPRSGLRGLAPPERLMMAGSAVVLLLIGLTALAAAPNTWDSMTYHMSRVAHWAHQGSLDPYPTHIVRQLTAPPLAEFAILQLQVLSGSDRLANLVQFAALCGCVVNATLIAARLGAGARGQVLAAVACVTLPMAVLQGSSTQNDLVAAFWLSCFVGLVCDRAMAGRPGLGLEAAAALGAVLGLALLTKGTAYLLCAGPLAFLVAAVFRSGGGASSAGRLAVVAVVAVILNLGHVGRAWGAFGERLPKQEGLRPLAEVFTPSVVMANAVRGVVAHFDTPFGSVNRRVQRAVEDMDRALRVDLSDPRITLGPPRPVVQRPLHEDYAGNPLHLVLLLVAGGALVFSGPGPVRAYVAALALSAAALCIGLKWQVWISRLQLPLFVLACPLIGVAAGRLAPRVGRVCGALLLVAALPWVLRNETRRLLGPGSVFATPRVEQYFANQPALLGPYRHAARAVAATGCAEAGLIAGGNDFEYPLWVLMAEGARGPVAVRHVQVANDSAVLRQGPDPPPCAVVAVGPARIPAVTESMAAPPEWVEPPVAFWRGAPR